MKNKIKRGYEYLTPYLCIIGLFFAAILLLKITETIFFFSQEKLTSFPTEYTRILYNTIVYAFIALMGLPIYALIRIISKKAAETVLSTLYAILFLTELGLTIYSTYTGAILNNEIIIRPIKETLFTINSVVHWWASIPLITGTIALFVWLASYCCRQKMPLWIGLTLLILVIGSSPFIAKAPLLMKSSHSPKTFNYITNKTWHCLLSCRDYFQSKKQQYTTNSEQLSIPTDEKILLEYLSEVPDWQVPDLHFPLERVNNIPDVLSHYFQFKNNKPNIVLLIVESLGAEWLEDICFTPFIDSLTNHSLYWKNCMSSTSRSFGVVPAITGSLPSGRKGFQFGNMPQHNSLISILKDNGYHTNGFYGCDWTFDCILDYMLAQETDYLANFYTDYKKNKDPLSGSWWGLHDHVLFQKTIDHLQQNKSTLPRMDLLITISSHDNLELGDDSMQNKYIEQTKKLISQSNAQSRKRWEKHIQRAAGIVYADECVRQFINDYLALPDGENTIFIITGDHASGIDPQDRLSYYRVPLIIWSPMLKQSCQFPALVTHNDIPPTITSLLASQKFIRQPKYVQWIGKELDTSNTFRSEAKMIIMDYSHEIKELIYNNHLYFEGSRWTKESVYEIGENLSAKPIDDADLRKSLAKKLDLYKYINNYVYHSNRITKHVKTKDSDFIELLTYKHLSTINCRNPQYKPSEKSYMTYHLMPPHNIDKNKSWERIKITLQAEVQILDSLFQDQHMNLVINCEGQNMSYPTTYKDHIVKFIPADKIEKKQWYPINITKEFIVTGGEKLNASIAINTPQYDELWTPNLQMNVRNIYIKIEGSPSK